MRKLKYLNESTGEWESIAPSQQEFDEYTIITNVSLADKASKQELDTLQNSIEFADVRVIVFIMQKEVGGGVQDAHVTFPFDGEILEMDASCSQPGEGDTYIRVEKSTDMETWNSISTAPLIIRDGAFFDDKSYVLFNRNVNKGDVFRVNVEQSSEGMMNLTVNVKIKIRNYNGGI